MCDDMIIYGCGDTYEEAIQDHNAKLEKLLVRLRQGNLKLNKEKIMLCKKQVKFFGHILTEHGVKADPEKIETILGMPAASNTGERATFLGMINYLALLSSVAAPLQKIAHENQRFEWEAEHARSFNDLKQMVERAPILQFFDASKPITLQVDASGTGLGAVFLQDGRPVAFASRTLTSAERTN